MARQEHLDILNKGVQFWNNWRINNPDIEPDLSDAFLGGRSLEKVDFSRTFLTGAKLVHANLHMANMEQSDFSVDILPIGYLPPTDFTGSDLDYARFNLSYIDQVIFNEASFKMANFSGAKMRDAKFSHNDLSSAIGLETINHLGPSSIGIDTFFRSNGKIPEVFLRGVGVPDNFIIFARSLTNQAIQFCSCFISYSHVDKLFAQRLHDQLQGRGIRCWLDEHQLLPGHNIADEIDRGIRLWDKFLLCTSEHSLTSWWVDDEIEKALRKEEQLWKQRGERVHALIPLNLDDYLFSGQWPSGKSSRITSRLAADFRGWEHDNAKFEQQFARVVRALRIDGGREAPPEPRL